MKHKILYILLIFSAFSFSPNTRLSKETVIYIVRHAEKDVSDAGSTNPGLNADGKIRAKDLVQTLKKEKFEAIFSTPYKRTMETAAPVAQRSGLPVLNYSDIGQVVTTIKTSYPNESTLIVGHSNTILEIAKAFGTQPPVEKLSDDDYDLLLKVIIDKKGQSHLKISRYGKEHHSTKISID
jgi:2,3-bisphosphoglycerate-dependent phosphoglycerate mutase